MVHPDDQRYQSYVGKKVYIPGTKVEIPVILDDYVDMTFGTGVVKVTPAHDPNDFEVGKRHHLKMPLCMHEDGTMNHMAFQYENMERFACRKALIKDLTKLDLIEKIEDYTNNVGYSERTGVVVEPRLSLQWFVKMDELSNQALEKSKALFVPNRFKKIFVNWMTDTQDWCISRQLWWGHRIPAWYKGDEVKVQIESPGKDWTQDEDVLDTWFSSALWPFSTLGWPEMTEDFKRYYPTQVMVTGYDIIFFWVARMIFQGLEFTKEDPFEKVLIHGLIRDADGRKMSKSLGNGVDPMDVIETYGVDALRYFLTTNSAPGSDLRYEEEKVESSWNFINKLWNITRFITMNIDDINVQKESEFNLQDKWILSRLSETIKEADYNYDKFEFGEVSRALYHFIWEDFANWYVEFAKVALQDESSKKTTQWVLLKVLKDILKLMHPFIPFVTEKLFLEISDEETIMLSKWPEADFMDHDAIEYFKEVKDAITKVRNLRALHQVVPSKPLDIELVIENNKDFDILEGQKVYFKKFLNTNELIFSKQQETKAETILLVGSKISTYVLKADIIDKVKEKETLLKQKLDLESEIKRSENLLNNEKFVSKAPEAKLNLEKEKFMDYKKQYEIVFKDITLAISWIETQIKFKPKTDLTRMSVAFKMLETSFDDVKLIHVAGTNGKGSVCAYSTHIFLEQGLNVGTYTSPYLIDFNERIRINGQNISDQDLLVEINFVYEFNQTFTKVYGENLAFFELITLAALHYYHQQNVDVIIMEVGLGGLLDATNVLNYDLSLITNIGFDHMKQLGNTLESISHNKLGILKDGNHLITTVDPSLHDVFNRYLKDLNVSSKMITSNDYELLDHHPLVFRYQNNTFELSLLGKHQILNAILAINAAYHLYPNMNTKTIQKALKQAIWAGRLEKIRDQVYMDGAHNTHALFALEDTLKNTFKDQRIFVLFSMLADKDIKPMLEIIKRFSYQIVLTSFDDPRFKDLSLYADEDMIYIKDFHEAYQYVKGLLKADDLCLITGSLHFVGYAKKQLI